MGKEVLDAELVEKVRKQKGVTKKWIWETYLGLNRTDGYLLLRNGMLPADPSTKKAVLQKLAKFTDLEVTQLLLSLNRPRMRLV